MEDKKLIDAGQIDELLSTRTERMRTDFDTQLTALTTSRDDFEIKYNTSQNRLKKHVIE